MKTKKSTDEKTPAGEIEILDKELSAAKAENAQLKEKLAVAEGQLQKADNIIEKLLANNQQYIKITGDHAVTNIVGKEFINSAEGMNSEINYSA